MIKPEPVKEPKEGEKTYAPKEPNAIEKILAGRKGFISPVYENLAKEGEKANWRPTQEVVKAKPALAYLEKTFGAATKYRHLAIDESKLSPELKAILPDAVKLSAGREQQLRIARQQALKAASKGKEEVGAER